MASDDTTTEGAGDRPRRQRRKVGNYTIGPRLHVAIEAMASGEARTISAAAEIAGMTREAVSKALRRENVREFLGQQIRDQLGVSAVRAARRMNQLLESENAMVAFRSSAYTLAVGAGIQPTADRGPLVNVEVKAGFVIDLSEPDDVARLGTVGATAAVLEVKALPAPVADEE